MASAGVDLLIGKVVSLLKNEASLLTDVCYELGELQSELESMRSFLLDAELMTQQTEIQRIWVSQLRDTTLEIEYIISEFNYHMNKQNVFPGLEGSCVVLTTRLKGVASFGFRIPSHVYHIQLLTENEA
ncbi:Disease resistance protein [Quillaja saponaria]|uniref:Disease resistance protein n=1 Tax=Quillaja saponaria TaxID=32244 RepID=A0AAD7L222_QUISA|nr:Disease resistance protein [Quillaja saponaria]